MVTRRERVIELRVVWVGLAIGLALAICSVIAMRWGYRLPGTDVLVLPVR